MYNSRLKFKNFKNLVVYEQTKAAFLMVLFSGLSIWPDGPFNNSIKQYLTYSYKNATDDFRNPARRLRAHGLSAHIPVAHVLLLTSMTCTVYVHCETQREFINNICVLQEPVEPRRSLEKVFY